ncbi:MAG: prepilin-type N-terminal cleavage/methylation domain-containing protein [Lentisphaeria bacterium]|nr:prepilin-type N-terminal cleavage/methylation domain-containing protein [Lentisphaeria bacterium]
MNRKYRFTLIELLIVIAIIAILAGMLLPALNQARETSKKIKCVGALKQYAMAGTMYANSFDDYWVPGLGWTYKSDYLRWQSNYAFRKILGGRVNMENLDEKAGYCDHRTSPGLICPKAELSLSHANTPKYGPSISTTYGVSSADFALGPWATGDKIIAYKLSRITHPTQRMAFCDSTDFAVNKKKANPSYYRTSLESGTEATLVAYRHGNYSYTNIALFDGHAETVHYDSLWRDYRFTKFYDRELDWNRSN